MIGKSYTFYSDECTEIKLNRRRNRTRRLASTLCRTDESLAWKYAEVSPAKSLATKVVCCCREPAENSG
jgi:hypothetical protein